MQDTGVLSSFFSDLLKPSPEKKAKFLFIRMEGELSAVEDIQKFSSDRSECRIVQKKLIEPQYSEPLFPLMNFLVAELKTFMPEHRQKLIKKSRFFGAHMKMFTLFAETGEAFREDEVSYQEAALSFEQDAFLDALGRLLLLLSAPSKKNSLPLVLVWTDFQNAGQYLLAWMLRFVNSEPNGPLAIVCLFKGRLREVEGERDRWGSLLRCIETRGLLARVSRSSSDGTRESGVSKLPPPVPDDTLWKRARTARIFLAFEDSLSCYRILDGRGTLQENPVFSLEIGEVLMRLGRVDQASLPLNQALEKSRKQKKTDLEIRCLSALCHLAILENNLTKARKYWKLAFDKTSGQPKDEVWYTLKVLQMYVNEAILDEVWFHEEFDAIRNYYKGRGWENTLGYLESLVPYYRFRIGEEGWESAVAEAESVLDRTKRSGSLFRQSVLCHCLGFIHESVGHKEMAQEWFRRGMQLRKKLGDPIELIKMYNGTGYYNFTIGDYRKATGYFQRSLALMEQVHDFPEICLTLYNMTLIYFFSGKFANALKFLRTNLEIMDALGLEVLLWHSKSKLFALAGISAFRIGQLSLSLEYLDKIFLESHDSLADPFTWLLEILVNQNQMEKSEILELFDRALAQVTAKDMIYCRVHLLAERAQFEGNLDAALSLAKEHQLTNQTIVLERLKAGAKFESLESRGANLGDRLTALISSLRSSARQEASGRRLLEKIHEVNFLRNFQTQVTSGQDVSSLFRKVLELVNAQFLLQGGTVWHGMGDNQVPVQAFGSLKGKTDSHFVYHFRTSSSVPRWIELEAAGAENTFTVDNSRTLTMAFQHLDLVLELLEARETLHRAATRDMLTGLFSRSELLEKLEEERRRAIRYRTDPNRGLALLFIDLDNFKIYNDTFGHASGDWALQRFSGMVMSLIRSLDIFGRYGGDEFLLVLPETTEKGARIAAEKILSAMREADGFLAELSVRTGEKIELSTEKKLGCSIGIALLTPESAPDAATLISQADSALYRAKSGGKGSYIIYRDQRG